MKYRNVILNSLIIILLTCCTVNAAITKDDYARADKLKDKLQNTVIKKTIDPHWFDDNTKFWYRNDLYDGKKEFILVDAVKATRQKAFDHKKMAAALTRATAQQFKHDKLPFDEIKIVDDGKTLQFTIYKSLWKFDLETYNCTQVGLALNEKKQDSSKRRQRPDREKSPDGKYRVQIKEHNVWLRTEDNSEVQLTKDGKEGDAYSNPAWSPDSKKLIAYKTIPGDNKEVYLIESSPKDGGRAVLHKHQYDLPGDKFTTYEMFIFDIASKTQTKAKTEKIDFGTPPWLRWSKDNKSFCFERHDRGHQRARIIRVDAETGDIQTLIDERSETFINKWWNNLHTQYTNDGKYIIWPSERDGYKHIYLYDANQPRLINQVTKGQYVTRSIEHVDNESQTITFTACGKEPGQDPYFIHYYKINFDGTGLVCLTPEKGTHSVKFSPDRKLLIDTYSRVDAAPVHELRCAQTGKLITQFEKADASRWHKVKVSPPEPFVAKGRDGTTDIYGIIHRPTNLDPNRKYPVIEQIYAGPHGSFVPKNWNDHYNAQLLTELGFIVVQIDGMGTNNRSKAFHDVCWKNLADAGFPDRILWIKEAAKKYSYMDITRVGIYGTSAGGQSSTGALLFHPDFYKVAVSSCGCHDNLMDKSVWNEQWMGYPIGDHYKEQSNITNAHKLKGNLMLFVGELDRNVPPESTYRLADALIKANREFELVVLPGQGHTSGGDYGLRKRRDFFVKHLLNTNPPDWNK